MKVPLWLVMKVQENEAFPFYFPVIFKLGDDLRQDNLTLQTIRLMDIVLFLFLLFFYLF